MCIEDLARHAKHRMSLDLKNLCYLSVEEGMSLSGICRMITDIQKCKNDNLFSDQVLVLLMFSNGGECEVAVKIVVLVCIQEDEILCRCR